MNSNTIYLLAGLIIVGFAAIIAFLNKKFSDLSGAKEDPNILMLNQNMQGMHSRLDKAAEVIGSLQRELGVFQEMGRGMKELQDLLRSPKARGNLGEQVLKDLLKEVLPPSNYKYQYTFRTGDRVDAIVKTSNGIIPIDSKFPMENFQKLMRCETDADKEIALKDLKKDIKAHIDKIAKKYILPAEGTVDFAIMYLPSEAVHYEVIKSDELLNYGYSKRVYVVSPYHFYYFLQIIMKALEGEKINETAKIIIGALRGIQQDARKFEGDLSVLSRHVGNASKSMETVNTVYARLGAKIEGTGQLKQSQTKQISDSIDSEIVEKEE